MPLPFFLQNRKKPKIFHRNWIFFSKKPRPNQNKQSKADDGKKYLGVKCTILIPCPFKIFFILNIFCQVFSNVMLFCGKTKVKGRGWNWRGKSSTITFNAWQAFFFFGENHWTSRVSSADGQNWIMTQLISHFCIPGVKLRDDIISLKCRNPHWPLQGPETNE